MGDIFGPIDGDESTGWLVSEQGKCLCDKGQTCWHINEEEDRHDQVEHEQDSPFGLLASTDVPSCEKKVNWCNNEGDNCDG